MPQLQLVYFEMTITTPGRRQSKTLSTIDERESNIDRNSVFDSHLSPVWRQMAIENTVSIDFYLCSSIVLAFSIATYPAHRVGGNRKRYQQSTNANQKSKTLFLLIFFIYVPR